MGIRLFNLFSRKEDTVDTEKVRSFIDLLTQAPAEQRASERVACHREMVLYTDQESGPIPVVMRDISVGGIGLVHDVPLDLGEAMLELPLDDGSIVSARINIIWCRSTVKHCYISGGTFLDVFFDDAAFDC